MIMGMRKYQRTVAKARLKAMGVKTNRLGSNIMPQGNELRKKMRKIRGRRYLEYLRGQKPALWRRVMSGDLYKEGLRAQLLEGQRIKKRKLVEKGMKKRKIRQISAPAQ
jgi:hypothetical protein